MRLGLGNTLVDNGLSNPDLLSLDLQFATDKTLTARRGPTPVFTRASGNTGGVTYVAPAFIDTAYSFGGEDAYSVIIAQTTSLNNGRFNWTYADTLLAYSGTAWVLSHDGNTVATSAPTTAYRPDLANWGGTGVTVTANSTFGIVKAANDEPRFDYDPLTGVCKGLLIEELRTNLVTQSNAFSTSPWVDISTACAITQNQTGVDGVANSAWTFTDDSTTTIEGRNYSAILTSGTVYSLSIFVKKTTGTPSSFPAIWLARTGTLAGCVLNTTTGTATAITTFAGLTVIASTNSVADFGAFWKVTSIITPNSTGSWEISISPAGNGDGTGVINVVTTGSAVFYGAQLEAGAFATSYIPTTTTALERTPDVCSITGTAFSGFYNQSEGTLFANIQSTGSGDRRPIALDIGNNSQFYNFYSTSALSRYAQASGSSGSFIMAGTVPSVPLLYAGTLKNGDYSLALNGSIVGSSVVTLGATFTTMRIGAGGGGGAQFLCGHLAAIRYFKKRLPNAKLQAITA